MDDGKGSVAHGASLSKFLGLDHVLAGNATSVYGSQVFGVSAPRCPALCVTSCGSCCVSPRQLTSGSLADVPGIHSVAWWGSSARFCEEMKADLVNSKGLAHALELNWPRYKGERAARLYAETAQGPVPLS